MIEKMGRYADRILWLLREQHRRCVCVMGANGASVPEPLESVQLGRLTGKHPESEPNGKSLHSKSLCTREQT